jgi:cytochrome c-type biogenesis protein CcmH/NrfF
VILALALGLSLTPIWSAEGKGTETPAAGAASAASEKEIQKEVREIASLLRAPCCPSLTVSQHNSPTTMKMKREIAEMLRAGKSRNAIIKELKATYGDEIAPPLIPTLWVPYLLIGGPVIGLGLLALLGYWLLKRERSPTVLHMEGSGGDHTGSDTKAA